MKRVLGVRPESEYYMLDLPPKDQNEYVQNAVADALNDIPMGKRRMASVKTGNVARVDDVDISSQVRKVFASKLTKQDLNAPLKMGV
jgi:hypothetical protein